MNQLDADTHGKLRELEAARREAFEQLGKAAYQEQLGRAGVLTASQRVQQLQSQLDALIKEAAFRCGYSTDRPLLVDSDKGTITGEPHRTAAPAPAAVAPNNGTRARK